MITKEQSRAYWAKIHAIQDQHGCSVADAKVIFRNGNGNGNGSLSIDSLTALAQTKCDEIHGELAKLSERTSTLQAELARWGKVRDAVQPPVTETRSPGL